MLYEYNAVVTGVYDGDSVTVDVDLGFNTWIMNMKLRLYGIDTPEIRTRDTEEKVAGLLARDYLRSLILNKKVCVVTEKDKTGKYGRYLAEIYLDGVNINQQLLARGYAEKYDD